MEDRLCLTCKINKQMDLVCRISILELVGKISTVMTLTCNLKLEAVTR